MVWSKNKPAIAQQLRTSANLAYSANIFEKSPSVRPARPEDPAGPPPSCDSQTSRDTLRHKERIAPVAQGSAESEFIALVGGACESCVPSGRGKAIGSIGAENSIASRCTQSLHPCTTCPSRQAAIAGSWACRRFLEPGTAPPSPSAETLHASCSMLLLLRRSSPSFQNGASNTKEARALISVAHTCHKQSYALRSTHPGSAPELSRVMTDGAVRSRACEDA